MPLMSTANEMYQAYIQAEIECLAGKETRIRTPEGERSFKTEDLDLIRAGRDEWAKKMAYEAAGIDPNKSGGFVDIRFQH